MSAPTTTLAFALFAAVTAFACDVDVPAGPDGGADDVVEAPPTPALQLDRGSHDYGDVVEGHTRGTATFVVTNTSATATTRLSSLLGGDDVDQFELIDNGCAGVILEPTATCAIEIGFAPSISGNELPTVYAATLRVGGDADPAIADLAGRAIAPGDLTVDITSADFGPVAVGERSLPQAVEVENRSHHDMVALDVALNDAVHFAIVSDDCTGVTLISGDTCAIAVRFQPAEVGARIAAVTITSRGGAAAAVQLAGTGTEAEAVLVVSTAGPGWVESERLSCGGGASCIAAYPQGTSVTLTATAYAHGELTTWTGACASAGSSPTCTVLMDQARDVGVTFRYDLH